MSKPTNEVIYRYKAKTYRQIKIEVKIEKADKFKTAVQERGDTISGVLGKAIDDYLATPISDPTAGQ